MEKINGFLNQIYGNARSTLYFCAILGAVALFFIIVIIVTLIKSSHQIKNEKAALEKEAKDPEEVKEEPKENLSETQVFNNLLMGKDNNEKEEVLSPEEKVEEKEESKANAEDADVYLEKDEVKVKEEPHIEEQPTEEIQEDKSISELMEEKPEFEDVQIEDIPEPIKEDYTIEMPKVKPMDLDDYLDRRDKEENPVEETPTEVKSHFSNDELKERLAKLGAKKEEVKEAELPDADLEDLMKAVGLEDTMVIPEVNDEENHILGR